MQQVLSHFKATFHYCPTERGKHLAQTVYYWLKYTHLYSNLHTILISHTLNTQNNSSISNAQANEICMDLLAAKGKYCKTIRCKTHYCVKKLTAQTNRYDFEVAFQCKIHIC